MYTLTAATTKQSNVGYDWIPFTLLAAPWSLIDIRWLFPAFFVNTAIMYSLGALLHKLWHTIVKERVGG